MSMSNYTIKKNEIILDFHLFLSFNIVYARKVANATLFKISHAPFCPVIEV